MVALRSLLFNLAFYANLIVLMILGLPAMLFGRRGVFFMARTWAVTSIWLLEKICGLRLEFRGLENIPPGGYILAAKHQSFLETFSLVTKTPDFAIILKKQLMSIPVFGLYLSVSGMIGIDRSQGRNAMAQIIEQAVPALAAGRTIYIYPEGTRRAPGAPPAYKQGVAVLYEKTGAPCVPVALNTGTFWGRRGFTRKPGVAVIEFLPAIPPGLPREEFFARMQAAIEDGSRRLRDEALADGAGLDPAALAT